MTGNYEYHKNLFKSGRRYALTLILFVLSYSSSNLIAQDDNLVFERFNTSHGLSNNFVISILQDSNGYLWIGTNDGLNKYDGYNFTSYRNDPQDSTSISNNVIIKVFEDRRKNLWIGTENGLNLYDNESNSFKRIIYNTETTGTQADQFLNVVISIIDDDQGNLYLATALKGLTKFERKNNKFLHFYVDTTVVANINIIITIIHN